MNIYYISLECVRKKYTYISLECDISSRDDDNNDNSSDNKYCLIVKCERCIFVLN